MASAGLAGTTPPAQDEQAPCTQPTLENGWRAPAFSLSGGLDLTNAYFRRGYLIEEGGPVLQPFLTGSTAFNPTADFVLRPYATIWDSANLRGLVTRDQDVLEGMAGLFTTAGAATLDVNYGYYSRVPFDSFTSVNELGGRVAYDVARPWQTPGAACTFSLRPSAALYWEWMQQKIGGAGYLEAGLEPAFRFETPEQRLGVSLPMVLGMGLDGYYANAQGSNATIGYFSVGVAGSFSLPTPPGWGQWYLNASLLYVHLVAANLQAINHGDDDVLVGKVGIAFAW